jgi:hypothetical protein
MVLGKRFGLIFIVMIVLVLTVSLGNAASGGLHECQKNCSMSRRVAQSECTTNAKVCQKECLLNRDSCVSDIREEFQTCKHSCGANATKLLCLRDCSKGQREGLRDCSANLCLQECADEKKDCSSGIAANYDLCNNYCRYGSENRTCEGGFSGGQVFARGCEECVCRFDGKIRCTKTPFCHFDETEISRESCEVGGGLYQGLCAGPYFDIVCTSKDYCLCEGSSNYTCPEGYTCVDEFNVPVRRDGTIAGWKDMIGRNLGEIGVCAKKPVLQSCGNGVCEAIYCFAPGCPEPETFLNCPQDCSS